MALIAPQMISIMSPLNAPQTSGAMAAEIIMTAFQTYAMAAQNSMGFPVISMPAFSAGKAQLKSGMMTPVPAGAMHAQLLAGAINTAWMSVQTQFQVAPVVANIGVLLSQLQLVTAVPVPAGIQYIQGLANAIDLYCKSSIITGVIPGTPPVPFTGPPM